MGWVLAGGRKQQGPGGGGGKSLLLLGTVTGWTRAHMTQISTKVYSPPPLTYAAPQWLLPNTSHGLG